ncbi:MAG TPA: pinensin family lanthipeptide [Longimicrobium sp.]|nr:pinensin family lanthipeptide [Longimicrobium sp.]
MRKIKLELDTLAVQSFETSALQGAEGTVVAHAKTGFDPDCGSAYDNCPSARCATLDPVACQTFYC